MRFKCNVKLIHVEFESVLIGMLIVAEHIPAHCQN